MSNPPKILAFAGSTREGSFNRKLIALAAKASGAFGAQVTLLELKDYPMPLMNEDLEAKEGLPEKARAFRQLMIDHDALLIASPEYNSSFTPLLKNALDWASRKNKKDDAPLAAYKNKVAGLLSASPGNLGGLRSLVALRSMLGNIGVLVMPQQYALVRAHEAFNADGTLKDPKQQEALEAVCRSLVELVRKIGTESY